MEYNWFKNIQSQSLNNSNLMDLCRKNPLWCDLFNEKVPILDKEYPIDTIEPKLKIKSKLKKSASLLIIPEDDENDNNEDKDDEKDTEEVKGTKEQPYKELDWFTGIPYGKTKGLPSNNKIKKKKKKKKSKSSK